VSDSFFTAPRWKEEVRHLVNEFVREAARAVTPGQRLLDAGAGECAYAPYFAHATYESADLAVGDAKWDYAKLTYKCDLTKIPVEDGRFDHVLCTQTLEHVPDPRAVVRELARVLKPGGTMWVTAPFGSPMHQEPHDYWRYTEHGLRRLLSDAGLAVDEIRPCGGYFVRLNHELSYFSTQMLPHWKPWGCLFLPGFVIARWFAWAFDRFDRRKSYTMNYLVRATKPA
jgi:SAM-dependent methyltransferase